MSLLSEMKAKFLCCHDWKLEREIRVYETGEKVPYRIVATYVCRKCGKIKKINI